MKKALFLLLIPIFLSAQVEGMAAFALTSGGAEVDPILALSPDFYANTTSIVSADNNEGTEITEWSNLAQASPDGVAGVTPEVHVGTAGAAVQVSFVEANGDYLNLGQTLQYNPASDKKAWFIWRTGDAVDGNGTVFSQAVSTEGSRAFQFWTQSSGYRINLGGNVNSSNAISANQLCIVNVTSSNYDFWIDGTEVISNSTNIGSGNSAQDINIAARTNGSYQYNGDIDIIAFKFGATLSQGEIDAIFAAYQVN